MGRGWSFPPVFSKNGKAVRLVSDEDDISESLRILLSTMPGERFLQPEYGCAIRSLQFEQFTLSVQTMAKKMIQRAILLHETRVTLEEVHFSMGDGVHGHILITIVYTVRTTNNRFNMVYPLYLLEGTGVRTV